MIFTKRDVFWGGVLLVISDSIGAYITDQFTLIRFIGMFMVGATLYAIEIPNFFDWLERKTAEKYTGVKRKLAKTFAVAAFFNPLWIFRHFIFIYLLLGEFSMINLELFQTAMLSFVFNLPFALIGNYIIQNKVSLTWRFVVNAVFSALITLYYSLSPMIFG